MSTRLLLKLAGPVPSLKKCAAPVRRLLNTARYPLKTRAIDTRRRIILRRIHRPSKIRRATQTQKPCYSITQCTRAAFANIFVANIFAPPFGSDSQNFRSQEFCDERSLRRHYRDVYLGMSSIQNGGSYLMY